MDLDNISVQKIKTFLKKCSNSSTEAYDSFKEILQQLENIKHRKKALLFLQQLVNYSIQENSQEMEKFLKKYHFYFEYLIIDDKGTKLLLLQLPSIFTPEEWSFTFFEGLARYPVTEFQSRSICELGCGNGWITIALSQRFSPDKVYGLDINPRAITCARINLYLNAIDKNGELIFEEDGKTLLDRVKFYVSDLLNYCLEKKILVDRIIGCIPQVLNPDLQGTLEIVSENASDNLLYSLSNYYVKQGYVEDQFGLGLIAKALEESVQVLKPAGKVIFNMGGRPGKDVLERLFTRRGYKVRKVWQRIVTQAHDTDIFQLVEIENKTPYRFEFYMEKNHDLPVSAKTAWLYLNSGGNIAHSITVYEATTDNHTELKKIFHLLEHPNYLNARNSLDLSFKDEAIADEKIYFLVHLSEYFSKTAYFPYEETQGIKNFRTKIADYFWIYYHIPFSHNNFLIVPNRTTIIKNMVLLYKPSVVLVAQSLTSLLPEEWISSSPDNSLYPTIIEAPLRVDLICKLIQNLKPQIVITSLAEFESKTSDSFIRLIDTARQYKSRIIIDISPLLELSSTPDSNGIFEYLADNHLPHHVTLLCGLIKNRVYSDLELCMIISENKSMLDSLVNCAELTYSRTPILNQLYYEQIVYELIKFQINQNKGKNISESREPSVEKLDNMGPFIKLNDNCLKAFQHPSIKANKLNITQKTIRLDYGENSLASPYHIKPAIFESFARQQISKGETDLNNQISIFLKQRFGLSYGEKGQTVYADGVAPLFSALVQYCADSGKTMVFPDGTYGYFIATAQLHGTKIKFVKTDISNSFKLTPRLLCSVLDKIQNAFIYLNAPVVNPTGAIYSADEVYDLLSVANTYNASVILDTIFSGLEYKKYGELWSLDETLKVLPAQKGEFGGLEFVLLGGISKELAAGGLRFGFAYTESNNLYLAIKKRILSQPHSTLFYSLRRIFSLLNEHEPTILTELTEQRCRLSQRAEELAQVLTECGWEPLIPQGGLFMVAKPEKYLGKKIIVNTKELIIDSENIFEALFYKTGLLINNSVWTGIPGYCRFVISVEEEDFRQAIKCLQDFSYNVI